MSYQACAELVKRGDPDRFLATMAARSEHRDALFALYAFNLEVARAPWVTAEPMIAEMRLQWWLDVIEEIFEGKEPRHHEVVTPLAAVIKRHDLSKDPFDALINARRWDIYSEPHNDLAALEKYIGDTSGGLMALVGAATGVNAKECEVLGQYGSGAGIANLFLAIPDLLNAQKIPLIDGTHAGVQALATMGLERIENSASLGKTARTAMRSAWMAKSVLHKAKSDPAAVIEGRLVFSDFNKRTRLLLDTMIRPA